jgi:hypothetical protein
MYTTFRDLAVLSYAIILLFVINIPDFNASGDSWDWTQVTANIRLTTGTHRFQSEFRH